MKGGVARNPAARRHKSSNSTRFDTIVPTNYRLVAIQVGDLLKYTTSLNEIGRLAGSLFRFTRDGFPNDSITSQRAQLIHDWILSLARQRMDETDRDRLLVSFCRSLASDEHRVQVEEILARSGLDVAALNREGASAFASREFHPEITKHARTLFLQENYFHSVFEAAKAYNKAVRGKARSSKDGHSLMLSVWGCESGVLKVTQCESETDRNVQDGIKFLSAGLMQAVRNPTAHEPAVDWPIDRNDCLDILSFISFLFRKLGDAVYYPGL